MHPSTARLALSAAVSCAVLLFAGCSADPVDDSPEDAQQEQPGNAADDDAAFPEPVPGRVLIDFRGRDALLGGPMNAQQAAPIIASALGAGAAEGARVTSGFSGSFTRTSATQQALMVVGGGETPQPTLAILEGGNMVASYAFVGRDAGWQAIRKVVDIDDDGIDELLLGHSWKDGGRSGTDLLVASMHEGTFTRMDELREVESSDCDAESVAERNRRMGASVVLANAGTLVQQRYRAPCPQRDAQGLRHMPAEAAFERAD